MRDDLKIRDACPSDQDTIRKLTLAAYREYAAKIPAHWEDYRQNIVNTLADATSAEQIVAEQNGRILGSVLLYAAEMRVSESNGASLEWPEIRLLAVAPSQRGQGIGAALVQECVERTRAAGATALTLHTTDLMQTAMRLYERMGFVRFPELDFHPAPGLVIKGYRLLLGESNQAPSEN